MNRPLISVVIRCYNYAHFLRDCIASTLAIKYRNKEILVIDDGSTDGSREVILEYGNEIRAFFNSNGGQIHSSNFGYAQSRGDLIFFLDADDMAHPEVLYAVVQVVRPAVCKVQFPLYMIDGQGKMVGTTFPAATSRLPSLPAAELAAAGSLSCPLILREHSFAPVSRNTLSARRGSQ